MDSDLGNVYDSSSMNHTFFQIDNLKYKKNRNASDDVLISFFVTKLLVKPFKRLIERYRLILDIEQFDCRKVLTVRKLLFKKLLQVPFVCAQS